MLKYLFVLSFFLLFVKCKDVTSDEKWDNFKIKWTPSGTGGFIDQPKTQAKAESKSWKQVSNRFRGCSARKTKYPGFHFTPPKESPEFTLIYDKNGFIAGMQSLVSQTADTSHYDFETADWYEKDEIEGDAVYLATVYFIDPELICSPGRSQEEFDNQGVGNILWLQKKDGTFLKAPLEMDAADEGCFWKRHKCFWNMGTHYNLNLGYGDNDFDCRKGAPLQLLYIDNNLNGFVWTHIAPLSIVGTNWELTNPTSIQMSLRDPPSCITELAQKVIPRTMHVFFRDYQISNNKCKKLNEKDLPTSCKDSDESDENNGTDQVDCKWSEFSICNETCGQGIKTRKIDVHQKHGGQNCNGADTESCQIKSCPVDCKWSEFSSCSETCGQGIKTRKIDVHPKYGGQNCNGNDKDSCNDRKCPGNTEESDENNETDDGEDSDENSGAGQSVSVGIMFALSWLMIYNI